MDEERLKYVEEFGVFFEQLGGSRMLGRVLGALMVSDPPEMSAEELAEVLRASRGSISTATRTLVGMQMVQRLTRSGERRDYFKVKPDAWWETTRQRAAQIREFRALAERGLDLVGPADPEVRMSLEEMRDFYEFWEEHIYEVLRAWEERKER